MHALTYLGLESAGLNNRRSSWQSEIVFISPTRVGIPPAPFSRPRLPFPSPSPCYSAVLFPNRILIRLFFLQTSECLTLACACGTFENGHSLHRTTTVMEPLLRNTENAGENMNVCVPTFRASSTFWLNASPTVRGTNAVDCTLSLEPL